MVDEGAAYIAPALQMLREFKRGAAKAQAAQASASREESARSLFAAQSTANCRHTRSCTVNHKLSSLSLQKCVPLRHSDSVRPCHVVA